jgi:glycosyltransferase involved in cell wall biosynthesis
MNDALFSGAFDGGAAGDAEVQWTVAQEGSRQSYLVPIAFHRLKMLRRVYVDTWCRWGRTVLRNGPAGVRALATHYSPELPSEKVVSFGPSAIFSRVKRHFQQKHLTNAELGEWYCRFGERFATRVRDQLKTTELCAASDLFFGFNTNSLEALEWLRSEGIFTVVDQVDPGRIEEDIVIEESERWPAWARVPGRLPQDYWDRLAAEWEVADLILVNSEWSRTALVQQGVPDEKIITVPLAIDLTSSHALRPINPKGPLKVLWLGSVILRKGIQYLVDAARRLQNEKIEFLIAGPLGVSDAVVRSFPPNMELMGRLTRDETDEVYRRAHVFVLPTLSDGFAITQLEAMAHGLPVIATPNCGEVVTDGSDGLIVPIRDAEALADALITLNRDRERLRSMSQAALQTAARYNLPSNARLINESVARRRRNIGRKASVAL